MTSREGWRALCRRKADGISSGQAAELPQTEIHCSTCLRHFRRESDRKRHKCFDECSKPVHLQKGAVQCVTCN